ncbi:MAG: hypothetical protein KIS78_06835 [Labilithrix sp.]|nr:hypothetical protein [Labilithrix sp.]
MAAGDGAALDDGALGGGASGARPRRTQAVLTPVEVRAVDGAGTPKMPRAGVVGAAPNSSLISAVWIFAARRGVMAARRPSATTSGDEIARPSTQYARGRSRR